MNRRRKPKIAVVQFPGVNCEFETARAVEAAGGRAEIVRFNLPAADIARYDGYVLPGGFAYEDRVRAGAIAAKDAVVEVLAQEAERGKPLLGICNGAQILVEAGLVP
ncbi:MAG: phosphoribosylformylglycinamidine synthase subunit PurQ, partial [Candidatus Coatesbacteria bacterium]